MSIKRIRVQGCDDKTVVHMDLTDAEFALLERVSAAVNAASTYGCMPCFHVGEPWAKCQHGTEIDPEQDYNYCGDCPDNNAVPTRGGTGG